MSLLDNLKGVAAKDAQMIAEAEQMMGPEPDTMGFIKNVFWGRIHTDTVYPYPQPTAEEKIKADKLLADLDDYLETSTRRSRSTSRRRSRSGATTGSSRSA